MYNKQRDNHNRRQIAGKKPRIYAVFKTFCIVASQSNDRQMTGKSQANINQLCIFFFKSSRTHGFMWFSVPCKKFFKFVIDKTMFLVYFYFLLYKYIVSKDYSYI